MSSPKSLAEFDQAARDFLADYFGKRDDETLGEAMNRVANQENPMLAAFKRKRDGVE